MNWGIWDMTEPTRHFRLGLLINPLAGIGGSVGLKGSDGQATAQQALALGATPEAEQRALTALQVLTGLTLEIITYPGEMGEQAARAAGFTPQVLGQIATGATTAEDTRTGVRLLSEAGIDLLLFAGGDGTARDVCSVLPDDVAVLGIPAGVKIHSGVYAVTPRAAGELVAMLVRGELVSLADEEVRDIDETAFRQGQVRARYYGQMPVPQSHRYVQHVKQGGQEYEPLVLQDIAAYVVEQMEPDTYYVMGSGSTVAAVMEALGLANTLLGVDLVKKGELVARDCSSQTLLTLTEDQPVRIIMTPMGGQGHILGRGNQQLSPELIRRVGKENLLILSSKAKLKALQGRPLLVDSGDAALDQALCGVVGVITGYRDRLLYRLATV